MRITYLLAATSLVCLLPAAAFAQACTKPLALANEMQMESNNGGPSSVTVKLNGTDQKLTLATASPVTQLSESAAKALNLDVKRGDTSLMDENGNVSRDQVTIADFSMGRLHGTNVTWPISPGGGRGGGGGGGGGGAGGMFSLNYMQLYDLDVDFGTDKLRLFSQDHCPGGVLYWKAEGPVGVLPLTVKDGQVTVPVTLDGKAITAIIDTASPFTSVRAAVATRVLGVELGGPKAPLAPGGFGGQNYTWTVGALSLNALTLQNVAIRVRPDLNADAGGDPARAARARSAGVQAALANPQVVIGMDLLRKMHVYMAFGEKRLYLTNTVAALPAPAAPPKAP